MADLVGIAQRRDEDVAILTEQRAGVVRDRARIGVVQVHQHVAFTLGLE